MTPEKKKRRPVLALIELILVVVVLVNVGGFMARFFNELGEEIDESLDQLVVTADEAREARELDTKDTGSDHSPYELPSGTPVGYPATEDGICDAIADWVAFMEETYEFTFKDYGVDPIVYDDGTCFFQIYADMFEYSGYMDPETGDLFSDEAMTNYIDQDFNRGWLDGWLEGSTDETWSDEEIPYGYEDDWGPDLPGLAADSLYPMPITCEEDVETNFREWGRGRGITHWDDLEISVSGKYYNDSWLFNIFYDWHCILSALVESDGTINIKAEYLGETGYGTIDEFYEYYGGFPVTEDEWGGRSLGEFVEDYSNLFHIGVKHLPSGITWIEEPHLVTDGVNIAVSGSFLNSTGHDLDYFEAKFTLYNARDEKILILQTPLTGIVKPRAGEVYTFTTIPDTWTRGPGDVATIKLNHFAWQTKDERPQ